jgi:hypothetical protein
MHQESVVVALADDREVFMFAEPSEIERPAVDEELLP